MPLGDQSLEKKKQEINAKIVELLKPGAPLKEIARMLGAEDLLQIQAGRGNIAALRFDVRTYIQREAEKSVVLKLPDSFIKLNTVVTPPDEGETFKLGEGQGIYERKIIPRSRFLAEVLTELDQSYQVVSGTNSENMIRKESYQAFYVPGLKRAVFVNDEEGNATFVARLEHADELKPLMQLTKDELRELGEEKIKSFNYLGSAEQWKIKLKEFLTTRFHQEDTSTGNPFTQSERAEVELAPTGWKHELGASLYLGIGRNKVAGIIKRISKEHPEGVKIYRSDKGHVLKHYSPELIDHVKQELEKEPAIAPAGWETNRALAERLGVNRDTTQRIISAQSALHPEWLIEYKDASRQAQWFASPELVRVVTENIEKRVSSPEGWKVASDLIDLSRAVRSERVRKLVEPYRAEHPEWFKVYANKKRMIEEHYHPDLVAIISRKIAEKPTRPPSPRVIETRNFISSEKKPPSEWMNYQSLANELDVDRSVVVRMLEERVRIHPEWERPYLGPGGVVKYVHPELVAYIRKEIAERKLPPDGWKAMKDIAQLAGADPITVWRYLERVYGDVRTSHPEWFGLYVNASGGSSEHLHPDLIKIILDELTKREAAPEGWLTVLSFSNALKEEELKTNTRIVSSRTIIKEIAEKFRSSHPEWFQKYKSAFGKGTFAEHYHPSLLKLIKTELIRS